MPIRRILAEHTSSELSKWMLYYQVRHDIQTGVEYKQPLTQDDIDNNTAFLISLIQPNKHIESEIKQHGEVV